MPLSARNKLKGVIKTIEKGEVAATVKIEISQPATITSMITKEAAEELKLKVGDKVEAVIKASEVMVFKD
jgi:molybdopterin-binding protein